MKILNKTFGIIGGDMRNFYLAKALEGHGYSVRLCGFDSITECSSFEDALRCDILVFPIIPFESGKKVKAPLSKNPLDLGNYKDMLYNKMILTGKRELFLKEFPAAYLYNVLSYSDGEVFSVKNAVPTAEGAVALAIQNSPVTIHGSSALVCGYGRIGKVLSEMLRSLNAAVTVSARKAADLAWIESNGFNSAVTGDFENIEKFRLIFNTVPAPVFNKDILEHISRDALIIDLASKPGGVDFGYAEKLGIKTIHALALPGKTSPETAGKIIESSILDILEEDNG